MKPLLFDLKKRVINLLLISSFISLSSHAANSSDYLNQLQNRAKQQQLWKQTEWINLLHYAGHGVAPDDFANQLEIKVFFLADNGANNPEAELVATLNGIYDSENKDDNNAQCRFVARLNWLTQKLAINTETLPTVHCKKYIEWRKNVQPRQVTLVFPTYHLNSPSSMFGHTLLRLDPEQDQGESNGYQYRSALAPMLPKTKTQHFTPIVASSVVTLVYL